MADDRLWGGSLGDFAGSMAEEMEAAMNELLAHDSLQTLPTGDTQEVRDRRRLFIAIARGVIRHLEDKEKAFQVRVEGGPFPRTFTPDVQVREP